MVIFQLIALTRAAATGVQKKVAGDMPGLYLIQAKNIFQMMGAIHAPTFL